MRDGAYRTDVAYVWPRTLRRPACPPRVVYLDLNHWIALSKALSEHSEGGLYRDVHTACIEAVEQGRAVFPLSGTIYMEIAKIGLYRQRRDLRNVIEQISRYVVVPGRSALAAHEVEALLDSLVRINSTPIAAINYLGSGVGQALGRAGRFRIMSSEGEDVTAEIRSSHPGGPESIDRFLAMADLQLNRRIIDGPTPDEEPELRDRGWNPTAAFEVAERRAEQEIEQVQTFNRDPKWRRGRIRDVVAAREVFLEIQDKLSRGLADRDATAAGLFPAVEDTRRAFDSMPSFDVAVTLKASLHRNPNHQWTPNDLFDIDALASTLPYCDIVLTDRGMASEVLPEVVDPAIGALT